MQESSYQYCYICLESCSSFSLLHWLQNNRRVHTLFVCVYVYMYIHTFIDFSCVGIPCFNALASCLVFTPEGGSNFLLYLHSLHCLSDEENITFNWINRFSLIFSCSLQLSCKHFYLSRPVKR